MPRILNGEKMVSPINVAGNTGYSHIKEENKLKTSIRPRTVKLL